MDHPGTEDKREQPYRKNLISRKRLERKKEMKLGGIVPALVTPYDGEGKVNYEMLKKLVEVLLEDGADGFYVTGSTGECFLLSEEERIKITATVAESVNGRVPIVTHVGMIGAAQAAKLAKEAERAGATAVSSVPPFYYNFKLEELVRYYTAISDATTLPVMVYNIPRYSGVIINADNLGEIKKSCRVEGIKYTDSNLYELERIRTRYPEMTVMFGQDESFLYALPVGVNGAIGSTYNFMLKKFKRIWNAYHEGRLEEAEKIQHEACRIIDALLQVRDITAVKYLLGRKGIVCGDCRSPFSPITEAQKQLLDGIGDLD